MNQRKTWNVRRLLVCGLVLAMIPMVLLAARGRRILIDGSNTWLPDGDLALDLTGDGHSTVFALPMPANIGGTEYNFVWIHENGYVVLTEEVVVPDFPPFGAASLADIPGDVVIAPFYADVESRPPQTPEVNCLEPPRRGCGSDVTVATLDLTEPDPDQRDPTELRGFRVTWGYFEGTQGILPEFPPGVLVKESASADATTRGSFQLRLIDRSNLPDSARGDFDLELTYGKEKEGIPWQNVGIIGIKADAVLLDFAELKSPFYGQLPPDNVPSDSDPCRMDPEPADDSAPHFDKNVLFACNSITVSFRGGKPDLQTYTADLSPRVVTPTDFRANAGDNFSFDLNIDSLDSAEEYDTATGVTSTIPLPTGFTFVSATPGTLCDQTATRLRCTHPAVPAGDSLPVRLTLRSNVDGPLTRTLHVKADQFDPASTNNDSTLNVTIDPTADLTLTTCSGPTGNVAVNATASITCSVKNDGPQVATGVKLTAQLPSSVAFSSGSSCAVSGATLTCDSNPIAVGATAQFSIALTAVTAGSSTITASVVKGPQHDPTPPTPRNVTVTIANGGGTSGGGATSLLALLTLGLLRYLRRRGSYAQPPMDTTHSCSAGQRRDSC